MPGTGRIPRIFDSATRTLRAAEPAEGAAEGVAGLYVCGITPYDATHIGHAATYLAYDTLIRAWRDAGCTVEYVQNITDVDDPLLERAVATGVDWRDLAAEQVELFRADMAALGVIPPQHYTAVTEVIEPIAQAVAALLARGVAYRVPGDGAGPDVYFDLGAASASAPWRLGEESGLDRDAMLALFAERGGDPDRPGKRDALDPLLWRSAREGEPSWPSPMGPGRPGWHIECSVIATMQLPAPFTVNGGGSDLLFPHHEMSAAHAAALTGSPLARIYSHSGMVGYRGEKMSKSLGNLVLVSHLRESGTDPRALRLAILAHHYRSDWEWTDAALDEAGHRLSRWREWGSGAPRGSAALAEPLRAALARDLDTPAAIAAVDAAIATGIPATAGDVDAVHALLGVDLRH